MKNNSTPFGPTTSRSQPDKPAAMNHTDSTHSDLPQPTSGPGHRDCQPFADDLLAYQHGELPLPRRALVGWHLSRCPACRKELDDMNLIATTLINSEVPDESAPHQNTFFAGEKLDTRLKEKILSHLPETTSNALPYEDAAPDRSILPRRSPWLQWGMLAATACVLAAIFFPTFSRSRENARRSSDERFSGERFATSSSADHMEPQSPAALSSKARSSIPSSSPLGAGMSNEEAPVIAAPPSAGSPVFQRQADRADSSAGGIVASSKPLGGETSDIVLTPYRRVHKQGSLTVEVERLEAGSSAVETIIQKSGGFVSRNDLNTGSDGLQSASMEIRVPVKQFEAVVHEISALGKVQDKRIVGEDITARVSDSNEENNVLAADLRSKLAQYQEAKERAALNKRSVPNDWQQRSEIRQMRIQLAQVRARIELLKRMSDYASLSVQLREKSPAVSSGGFLGDVGKTGRAAFESFLLAARLPIALLIYVLVFSPFWLPILIAWRYFLRSGSRHTAGP